MNLRAAVPQDAPAIARVHVASWRETYRGIVPQSYLDALNEQQRAEQWQEALDNHQEVKIAVAEMDGKVCGFASGGKLRKAVSFYDGELYALYLDPTRMRLGVGRALFKFIAHQLAAEGLRHLLVWTLRDNPSKGFYERLGGVLIAEEGYEIGDEMFAAVAYGWPDFPTNGPFSR